MKILTLDVETFYSTTYSLGRMSTPEYILSPEFEFTGLAVKEGDSPSYWVHGTDVPRFFKQQDTNVMSVSHNALFDNAVFAWRCGWVPRAMADTLGISRALLQAYLRSLSLGSVAEYLGLGKKGTNLANVKGMRLAEIQAYPDLYAKHIDYGLNDADLCYGIFQQLVMTGKFPKIELAVMDAVLRCAVTPQFVVNVDKLHQSLAMIKQEKQKTLAEAMALGAGGMDHASDEEWADAAKSTLMSNDKFALLLEAHGVEPPKKISGITGKETYAFAKSDQEFVDLLEHPNIAVQTLMAARLGHKSTIEETRHERFIAITNLDWPATTLTTGGNLRWLPMPLKYSGAHTHRLSGDWKFNVQNMGRGSMLRESLEAPEGYTVVAGDESQVEARFVAELCGQWDLRDAFARGEDVYCDFASTLYNRPITKKEKTERWMGKTCILGLGFGLGDEKFESSIPPKSLDQLGVKMILPPGESKRIVNTYRNKYRAIKATWKLLNEAGIQALSSGVEWRWGPVIFRKEEIELPNGMKLYYHNLRLVPGGRFGTEWVFDYGGKVKRLYGGKLLENIVQALARIITMEAAVRIRARLAKLRIPLALQVHDELVFVVKHEHVAVTKFVLAHELRQRPLWLPNLPLDCEVGSGPNYGEAK